MAGAAVAACFERGVGASLRLPYGDMTMIKSPSVRASRMLTGLSVALALSLAACGGGGDGGDAGGGAGAGGAPPSDPVVSALAPTHGQAGTEVTLTGSGFSTVPSENVVTLNNMPCTVVAASATELKVAIPARAGSGALQVTVLAKTAQSPTFTYDLSSVTVSTLAGSELGYLDDVGTTARFNAPTGLAYGAAGTLYVADALNNRIRIVSPAGAVSTFVGSATAPGYVDGDGLSLAQFYNPDGLAFDASGNLFVADFNNNSIRKISPAGFVSTFSTFGFSGPSGLAFDKAGNLYVADKGHHQILKVDSRAAVTVFAGSGTPGLADGAGTAAQFQFPTGLTFCSDGSLFVADMNNHRIRKITPAGVVTTHAGGIGLPFADGSLTEARFLFPRQLACDGEGKLFVVDTGNERIRMITPSGVVNTLAGTLPAGFADGDGATARFSLPQYIAIATDGSLVVSDGANERIRKIVWR